MKEEYYNTLSEEQETTIVIDYFARVLSIYSSRKSIIERLSNKLGEPSEKYFIKKKLTGTRWNINFNDKKKIGIALSRPLLIGQMK